MEVVFRFKLHQKQYLSGTASKICKFLKLLMKNKSELDEEYSEFVKNNPEKRFILYLRSHPSDERETLLKCELESIYGKCKVLKEERLTIFILTGNRVFEFIDKLNNSNTEIYLSFIQSEDDLKQF